jgi:hypothetical protein
MKLSLLEEDSSQIHQLKSLMGNLKVMDLKQHLEHIKNCCLYGIRSCILMMEVLLELKECIME